MDELARELVKQLIVGFVDSAEEFLWQIGHGNPIFTARLRASRCSLGAIPAGHSCREAALTWFARRI
jgi:hypothetical protein